MAINLKIDVTKIPKGRIFIGKKGKYLDLRLVEKADDFGNDGFVAIDVSKEQRGAGERGEIIGNWREYGQKKQTGTAPKQAPKPQAKPPADPDLDADDSDIPF